MMPATVRPRVVAVWLLGLFIPYAQSESITGDLFEEFSDLATRIAECHSKCD
jgi:hypothetical protein